MKIKYIIAIVLLGMVAYTGTVLLISGVKVKINSAGVPVDYEAVLQNGGCAGMRVSGELESVKGKFRSSDDAVRVFGVDIGATVRKYYYVIQVGYSEDISKQKYAAIALTSEEDIKLANRLIVYAPQPKSGDPDRPRLKFTGYVEEMDTDTYAAMRVCLSSTTYLTERISGTEFNSIVSTKYDKYIISYVIHVQHNDGAENFFIALGAACCIAGIGGIVMVFLRIRREKSEYY